MTALIVPLHRDAPQPMRLLTTSPSGAPEPLTDHTARFGPRPYGGRWLVDTVRAAGLRGRGGGWFPAHRKWDALEAGADPILIVNASEGEPLSAKDRRLLTAHPHLVLDGAMLVAESLGSRRIVVYISRPARHTAAILRGALRERRPHDRRTIAVTVAITRHRYVAGESSAVVRRIAGGPAKPEFAATRAERRTILGRPALIHNVETLAHVALIARHGAAWYRQEGTPRAPGTTLLTVTGAVEHPGVYEVAVGTHLDTVLDAAGGCTDALSGVLLGGYFGRWHGATEAGDLRLDPDTTTLGCGLVGVVGRHGCGLRDASRIAAYLAAESAGQCGPCVFGLRSLAAAMHALAEGDASADDVARIRRWSAQISGRGACRHPDGAVDNALSALHAFDDDVERHLHGHACPVVPGAALPSPPRTAWRWR